MPYELEAWEEHDEASREKFVPKINNKSRKIALGKDTTQPVFERLHTLAGVKKKKMSFVEPLSAREEPLTRSFASTPTYGIEAS